MSFFKREEPVFATSEDESAHNWCVMVLKFFLVSAVITAIMVLAIGGFFYEVAIHEEFWKSHPSLTISLLCGAIVGIAFWRWKVR